MRKAPDEMTNQSRTARSRTAPPASSRPSRTRCATRCRFSRRRYQTWGRDLDVEVVEHVGHRRGRAAPADAVSVVAMKPFAVIDLSRGRDLRVGVWPPRRSSSSAGARRTSSASSSRPYRWPLAHRLRRRPRCSAPSCIGKNLVGKPAKFAGDEALQTQEARVRHRAVGIAPQPRLRARVRGTEEARWQARAGPHLHAVARPCAGRRPPPTRPRPTLVTKLKDSGVTSILVLPIDYQMTAALTKAATKNDYHPEWIVDGCRATPTSPRWHGPSTRTSGSTRSACRALHAGEGTDGRTVRRRVPVVLGTERGRVQPGRWSTDFELLYAGIHMAGPKLTPQTYQDRDVLPAAGRRRGRGTGDLDGPLLRQDGEAALRRVPHRR